MSPIDNRPEDKQRKSREDAVKCPYCQRSFASQDDLTLHIVTRHTHSGGVGRGVASTGSKG